MRVRLQLKEMRSGSTEYIWLPLPDGAGSMLVGALINGQPYAVHTDHLTTPRLITDKHNQPVWQWAYSAFGDQQPSIAAGRFKTIANSEERGEGGHRGKFTFNLRYPGQYFDQESGLNYNYFRSYDSKSGRYTQADPIGLGGGWNRFSYVHGNTLLLRDPLGLNADPPGTYDLIQPSPMRADGLPHGAGCGEAGNDYWIPDGFGNTDFTPACRRHDTCYDTCGNPKSSCDDRFKKDLYSQCAKGGGGIACRFVANRYRGAMSTATSQAAYGRAQKESCPCK